MCKCTRVHDILRAETEVIKAHLNRHKWYNHIKDENEAVMDFIWKYAWLMREIYCGRLCGSSQKCDAGSCFRAAFLSDISDGELVEYVKEYKGNEYPDDLTKIQLQVIKHHISMHKWFHRINNYHDAVKDFIEKFGWVIDEMCKATKKSN
jgi:hypothetical protein